MIYAIGDIHGQLGQLDEALRLIEQDGGRNARIVFLGDYTDRGPDSRGVIDAARDWSRRRAVRILFGNHEEMFLKSLEDEAVLRQFIRFAARTDGALVDRAIAATWVAQFQVVL